MGEAEEAVEAVALTVEEEVVVVEEDVVASSRSEDQVGDLEAVVAVAIEVVVVGEVAVEVDLAAPGLELSSLLKARR